MITSGLVLTLSADPVLAGKAQTILRQHNGLTPGQPNQRWLPVVAESPDVAASRDLHDWLNGVPGVEFVDVVHVDFQAAGTDSINEVAYEH